MTAQPKVKCLIVDDREENLLVLSALLRRDDVEILKARSGPEALELLLVHDVALALLDVQMPEMDGFELAELMRGSERTRHVPLIFVTAGAHDHQRIFKGYESGAVDFLYKPIETHVLRSKAEVFFQLYRQRRQLTQQLHERTETLRFNETFTAMLGHDLRNPLNAMMGFAHLVEASSEDPDVQDSAARILSSGRRMSRLIEDMVDLAQARLAGGIRVQRESGDLGAWIERVAHEHRVASPSTRIEFTKQGDLEGEWDMQRLAQVASNLLGNAVQHGASGETIHVQLDGTEPDSVTLSVSNKGSIDADLVPHLFDPFCGGHPRAGRGQRLGLGLFIVQHLVRAHHGEVTVEIGDGAQIEFRARVPRRAPRASVETSSAFGASAKEASAKGASAMGTPTMGTPQGSGSQSSALQPPEPPRG